MSSGGRVVRLGPYPGREGEELGLLLHEGAEPRVVRVVWLPGVADEARAALAREIDRAAEALQHPHIQPPLGLEELDGRLAMLLDLADGETLEEILAVGGRMPPPIAARVVHDACAAVHFAHEEGQEDALHLHGWLRPSNLFVSRSGVTLVSGFGVGLARDAADLLPWQSPEQILGGPRVATRASDVYCLGLVLHAALAGENPFEREPDPDVAILSRSAPSLEPLGVPAGLAAVVRRSLMVKGADRYQDAGEVARAIEESGVAMATPAQVAAFVESLFPAGMGMRVLRQRAAEAGREAARSRAAARAPSPTAASATGSAPPPRPRPSPPPVAAVPAAAVPVAEIAVAEIPASEVPVVAPASELQMDLFPGQFEALGRPFFPSARGAAEASTVPAPAPAVAPAEAAAPAQVAEVAAPARVSGSPEPVAPPPAVAAGQELLPVVEPLPDDDITVEVSPLVTDRTKARTPARPLRPAEAPPRFQPPRRSAARRAAMGVLAVAIVAAAGGLLGWWLSGKLRTSPSVAQREPVAEKAERSAATAPPGRPAPPAPAPGRPASAPAAAEVETAPSAASAPPSPAPAPAAPPAAQAAPRPAPRESAPREQSTREAAAGPLLEITSSTDGEIIVDGRRAGRPPISRPVRSGRHEVRLVNRALGLDVARLVDVRPPRTQLRIDVGQGRLTVNAPQNAEIFLDGRRIGSTQVRNLEIWEGRHQLLVTLGASRNEHAFEIGPDETYEYEVTAQAR